MASSLLSIPGTRRQGRGLCILLAVLLLSLPGTPAAARAEPLPEYKVKAVFLHNFGKYVTWPASVFASQDEPFVIGVLGQDPFGDAFAALQAKPLQGRQLVIRRLASASEAKACQILFISSSERAHLEGILAAVKGSSILTVSDIDNFARSGGMIQLVIVDNRIRFNVNLKSVQTSKLTISSNMLKLASSLEEN